MKSDLFQDSSKTIPRSDPRIHRIDFDHSEIGARKSHISGAIPKNTNSIRHVKEGA